jgi:DNA-directed RNA polymerase subunit RPC12/RpoP
MPVKVRCSSCDKVLTVPDAARGKAVKCPQCDTKIAVPAGDADDSKVIKPKKKPAAAAAAAKPKKRVDSEDALMALDLRRAEDTNARICSKCGFDMHELDEEETECPKCGFDIEAGGMGAKARKRALRGPDPADFYPGLAKNAGKFVGKNILLAWRTDAYTLVCLLISLFCVFMYLWLSAWPPRAFFALCFFVSFLVIPGWLWYLDTEVIKLTLERKDKFKKLNFDFFLASSKGVIAVAWALVGAGPILLLPAMLGYYLVHYSGQPEWMLPVCIGVGLVPIVWMLPITMSHMTMPISVPAWMFWKVIQFWGRTLGGCSIWLMWILVTNIPNFAAIGLIAGVWGNDIQNIVQTMESNADINRQLLAAENAPKGKNAKPVDITAIGKPVDVDLKPLIGPVIVLVVMCLPIGFIAMFNMRINGLFTYYFRDRMELVDKAKDYKYVAKARRNPDDDEEAPRTLQKDATEGVVLVLVFVIMGCIGGMLYGTLTDAGVTKGVLMGARIGTGLASLTTGLALLTKAFQTSVGWGFIYLIPCVGPILFISKHWELTRKEFFQAVVVFVISTTLEILTIALIVAPAEAPPPAAAPAAMPGAP